MNVEYSAGFFKIEIILHLYIVPLKPQHVENTTVQWKSAGDELNLYKKWGGHVPRAPGSHPKTIQAGGYYASY